MASFMTFGRPAITTTMVRGFAAATFCTRSVWSAARALLSESPTPSAYGGSPTTTMAASAEAAAAGAAAGSAQVTVPPCPCTALCKPWKTVSPGRWLPLLASLVGWVQQPSPPPSAPCQPSVQPPTWSARFLAIGSGVAAQGTALIEVLLTTILLLFASASAG